MRKSYELTDRGMTMVEVLVVMLIIGILSSIAVPIFGRVREQAIDKKVMTDMRNIALAIGLYKIEHSTVPDAADATELVVILKNFQGKSAPLSEIDAWGHQYDYLGDAGADAYTLKSFGRDGVPGVPATPARFDADADVIVIDGLFVASHQGAVSIAR